MKKSVTKLSWGLMAFLSVGIVGYALVVYLQFNPELFPPDLRPSFTAHPIGIYAHIIGSSVALLLGPIQFLPRLRRKKHLRWHRWLGRIYLGIGILVGGLAGLYMSLFAYGGLTTTLGFGGLALAWLFTGVLAYTTIRRGETQAHRRWMIRNFALTFAAVTLRLWLPLLAFAFRGFDPAYRIVAWLSWIPNLIVAEMLIRRAKSAAALSRRRAVTGI